MTEMLDSHEKQVAAFKEQIRQHALTIVSLEEKAKKAQQEHQASRKEAKELEKRLDGELRRDFINIVSIIFIIISSLLPSLSSSP